MEGHWEASSGGSAADSENMYVPLSDVELSAFPTNRLLWAFAWNSIPARGAAFLPFGWTVEKEFGAPNPRSVANASTAVRPNPQP